MKTILLLILVFMLIAMLGAEDTYMIIDNKGNRMSVIELAESIRDKNVIFFGEFHGEAVCHKLEIELLKELYALNPKIIVSLEMFERDVQSHLDNYLASLISEEDFLANSRPWPNYKTDYRPLVEFAKEKGLKVVASNVPRRYASLVAKSGTEALSEVPDIERVYFSENLIVLNDEYKRSFVNTINQGKFGDSENGAPIELLERMYAAQSLKDDTMAESIVKALAKNKDPMVIHYNGDFHSRKHLGTVKKTKLLTPDLEIAVLAPVYTDKAFSDNKEIRSDGDYLILIYKSEE